MFAAHTGEVLCLDWNKYNANVLATGGLDQSIRLWVRGCGVIHHCPSPSAPAMPVLAHPLLLSPGCCSYDTVTRIFVGPIGRCSSYEVTRWA